MELGTEPRHSGTKPTSLILVSWKPLSAPCGRSAARGAYMGWLADQVAAPW